MNGMGLIRKVEKFGGRVWAEGGTLQLDLPGRFPESLVDLLRKHKAEVLSILALPKEARPLIDWACWLAEVIPMEEATVSFEEAPFRPVDLKLADVGLYVSRILGDLGALQSAEAAGAPDLRPGWRRDRIKDLCQRLVALREALGPLGLGEIKKGHR